MNDDPVLKRDDGLFGLRVNRDMSSLSTSIDPKRCIYLLSDLKNQSAIFLPHTIIQFLSGLICEKMSFQNKKNRKKKYREYERIYTFDRCLILFELRAVNEDDVEYIKVLKIYYDTPCNFFLIQVVSCTEKIVYKKCTFDIEGYRHFQAWVFQPIPPGPPTERNVNGYNNNFIISYLSRYLNNKINLHKVNQFTASCFADISPPCEITISNRLPNLLNARDLHEMFNILGGYLFMVVGDGLFQFDGNIVKAFVWIPNVTKKLIRLGNCIQLDASFKAVEPDVFCTPMAIYRNTALPLGLIVGPTECSELYSLFYEALFLIDRKEIDHMKINEIEIDSCANEHVAAENNQDKIENFRLFNVILEKYVLSDQHSSFEKLQSIFHFELFYCYVHLIRSFGASSAISILVREVLFCKSEAEFQSRCYSIRETFKLFLEIGGSAVKYYDKFIKIFGFDENGNRVERDRRMEPLFIRIEKMIPTSTNHIERFHRFVNESIEDSKNSYKKLGILFKCIDVQINHFNENLLRKLKDYINNLRMKAQEIVENEPEKITEFEKDFCDVPFCADGLYYSNLYGCELPCIHQILNKKWANSDYNTLYEFGIDELKINTIDRTKEIIGFIEDKFKKNADEKEPKESGFIDPNLKNSDDRYDSMFANIINKCFNQLKCVMGSKIHFPEVAGYACEEQILMLQEEHLLELYSKSPDDFMIKLGVRILKHAYEKKNMLNKF